MLKVTEGTNCNHKLVAEYKHIYYNKNLFNDSNTRMTEFEGL